ncbi:MAG: hypothetical protein J0I12_11165 [Candidatus Eremiobacteraeota bacterium]|nr:hypothetical protein [Candidatus Eremiobacteraeota bacterium]
MPNQDPEKRRKYQKDLMRERRAGEETRSVKITIGELPPGATSEQEFHENQLMVASRMQALARAALESMKEITPRQALEFLDQSHKIRAASLMALAALNKTEEDPEEGGFGAFGRQFKERLGDDGFIELALGLLTYAPPTDAPKRKAPAGAKPSGKAPAKPKGRAAKKPDSGANPKAPKGRAKT